MRSIGVKPVLLLLFCGAGGLAAVVSEPEPESDQTGGRTLYVRQTVGDDRNDGLSPQTAWSSASRSGVRLRAGDRVYVGPGLYRSSLILLEGGTSEKRITLIADAAGQYTGDPPGTVILAGSDPIDESLFSPGDSPGTYVAHLEGDPVRDVVEMGGPQRRYIRAAEVAERRTQDASPLELVAQLPSSFFYEDSTGTLHIHTGDGRPPKHHELEVTRRITGIALSNTPFVTVRGFTLRHFSGAGIAFSQGSDGGIAVENVSFGNYQGIRVGRSAGVVISGNTLFRNANSGAYFLGEATGAIVVGNIAYENVKGLRWSTRSNAGLVIHNTLFENIEGGIALESTKEHRLIGNILVENVETHLKILASEYHSEGNCFGSTESGQPIVTVDHKLRYWNLAEYQRTTRRDLSSMEGECPHLPGKVDVQRLHAESLIYTEKARRTLAQSP